MKKGRKIMQKIQILNKISDKGLELFPKDGYEMASEIVNPDAVLLRSYNMHTMEIPESVKAIARAGSGVNNIVRLLQPFVLQGIKK